MNDPNGLYFYKGENHLFYQHNPFENKFGHLGWGHAVSKDLVHWEHLPVALTEEDGIMIFSGCIVVDYNNTSGFGKGDLPPVIAVYTGNRNDDGRQFQCLAYSNDNGINWTKYKNNPVLDIQSDDFRDPKVFRYEPGNVWIMIVACGMEKKMMFFSSANLIKWEYLSDFSYPEFKNIKWECPDIFRLPVDNNPHTVKWVLFVAKLSDNIATDTSCTYFVGDFNGKKFIIDEEFKLVLESEKERKLDCGRDFYAAATWGNIPNEPSNISCIAWMNNWKYAEKLPTIGWNGSMTIPRRLFLSLKDNVNKILQKPIQALEKQRKQQYSISNTNIKELNSFLSVMPITEIKHEIIIEADYEEGCVIGFELYNEKCVEIKIIYDDKDKTLLIDRNNGTGFVTDSEFYKIQKTVFDAEGKLNLRIYLDSSSVEIFANDGELVMSSLFFASCRENFIRMDCSSVNSAINLFSMWELESICSNNIIEISINSSETDII